MQVQIKSIPDGASVMIDSKPVGVTPLFTVSLSPGIHAIELQKNGYVPLKWKTTLQDAATAEFAFRLNAIHEVKFISKEKGLRYQFDGKVSWSEKRVIMYMEEGQHDLKVYRVNELIDRKPVTIVEPTKIVYKLE